MKHRPKPEKRKRQKVERPVHRNRLRAGRVYRVEPEPGRPYIVEVRIARDGLRMRELMNFHDGQKTFDNMDRRVAGLSRTWHRTNRPFGSVARPRFLVSRIYLNARDLRDRPSEIVSHECAHAAMGYARLRRADLSVMAGEEVMAHALGRLVAQVNRVCYAAGAFP